MRLGWFFRINETLGLTCNKGEYTDQCLRIVVLVPPYWPKIFLIVGIKCEKTIATLPQSKSFINFSNILTFFNYSKKEAYTDVS